MAVDVAADVDVKVAVDVAEGASSSSRLNPVIQSSLKTNYNVHIVMMILYIF